MTTPETADSMDKFDVIEASNQGYGFACAIEGGHLAKTSFEAGARWQWQKDRELQEKLRAERDEKAADAIAHKHGFSLGAVDLHGNDIPEARSWIPSDIAKEAFLAGIALERQRSQGLVDEIEHAMKYFESCGYQNAPVHFEDRTPEQEMYNSFKAALEKHYKKQGVRDER